MIYAKAMSFLKNIFIMAGYTVILLVISVYTSLPARAAAPADYGLTEGDLISAVGSNDPDIYIVNEQGYKRLFLNPAIFNFYGHLQWGNVKTVSSSIRDAFATSGLFRNCEANDPRVYGMEITAEDTATLHWVNITADKAVTDDPSFFKKVFCINSNEFQWYQKGSLYASFSQMPVYSRISSPSGPPSLPIKVSVAEMVPLLPRAVPGCAVFGKNEFYGCYYDDGDFTNLKLTRADPKINFNWDYDSPDPVSIGADTFSVRWQGDIEFPNDIGVFTVITDDGMRIWVDDKLVFDKWLDQPPAVLAESANISKGTHRIIVDYYENGGGATAQIEWGKSIAPYFTYSWRATQDLTGEVQLPMPAPRPVFILDGKPTITLDTSAAVKLAEIYRIVLADDEMAWDEVSAGMLYEMVRRLPERPFWAPAWRITLTGAELSSDIDIALLQEGNTVRQARFSKVAFVRSNPTLQSGVDGNFDRIFYSNRLFRAALKAFYNDRGSLEIILKERYGIKPGFAEPLDEFQEFTVEELQYLVTVFEDMPSGFRNMQGFEKVVRRKNGLTNPVYPGAPAIAWVTLGYIEFMDFAFREQGEAYIRKLIAHEIAHFLWHNILKPETRDQFAALSGWSKTAFAESTEASLTAVTDHPKAKISQLVEMWHRRTTTNFVSDYAAGINPDEDFAETIAYYIYEPDKVRTYAPDKYDFVKKAVNGYEYVILVDQKYTFQVFNLEPDLVFPGKIIGVDIRVTKFPSGDNEVAVSLHLSSKYGDGAADAYTRITSPTGTYVDTWFSPVDGDRFHLRAKLTLNKYVAHGYWTPSHITVRDSADNRRYEPQNQFGWLMFIDNADEDTEPPVVTELNIRGALTESDGEKMVVVRVPVTDKSESAGLRGNASLEQYDSGQNSFVYARHDKAVRELVYEFPIRKYKASGTWTFREFWVADAAGNWGRHDLKERALTFAVETPNPDYTKPELDLSSIRIRAVPTRPSIPNGETDVTIWYKARDNNSGLGNVNYSILRPTGGVLFDYHYHENFYTDYFVGGPSDELKEYQIGIRLPVGSPPGTWILQEISITDKAGNQLRSNFIETGIVRPFDVK